MVVRLDFLTKIDKIHATSGIYIQIVGDSGLVEWFDADGSFLPSSPSQIVPPSVTNINVLSGLKPKLQPILAVATNQKIVDTGVIGTQYWLYPVAQHLARSDIPQLLWPNSNSIQSAQYRFFGPPPPPPPPVFPYTIPNPFYIFNTQAAANTEYSTWIYGDDNFPIGFHHIVGTFVTLKASELEFYNLFLYRAAATKGTTRVSLVVKALIRMEQDPGFPSYSGGVFIRTYKSNQGTEGAFPNGDLLHTGPIAGNSNGQPTLCVFNINNATGAITQIAP